MKLKIIVSLIFFTFIGTNSAIYSQSTNWCAKRSKAWCYYQDLTSNYPNCNILTISKQGPTLMFSRNKFFGKD